MIEDHNHILTVSKTRRNVTHSMKEFARRKPLGGVGAVIILVLMVCALLSPLIVP